MYVNISKFSWQNRFLRKLLSKTTKKGEGFKSQVTVALTLQKVQGTELSHTRMPRTATSRKANKTEKTAKELNVTGMIVPPPLSYVLT